MLTLVYRGTRRADHKAKWVAGQTGELTPTVSRAGAMPAAANAREVVPSEAALVAAGMGLFQKVGGAAALPCTRLGLVATKFVEMQAASILSFFGAASAAAPKQQQEGGAGAAAAAAARAGAFTSSPAKAQDGQKQQQEQEDEGAAAIVVIDDSPPATSADDNGGGGDGTEGRTRPCAKCGGRAIAQEEWGEHADWHVAMDLQRAYGGGGSSGGAGAGAGGDRTDNNKRPGPTGGQGARPGKQTKAGSGPKSHTLDTLWNKKK